MSSRVKDEIVRQALIDVLRPARSLKKRATSWQKKGGDSTRNTPSPGSSTQAETERPPLHVAILEQPTANTLIVYWSDPCLGRYADQIWRIGPSRVDSLCVLTGVPIRRGDMVYRPRVHGSYRPANRHKMILASAATDYLRNQIF